MARGTCAHNAAPCAWRAALLVGQASRGRAGIYVTSGRIRQDAFRFAERGDGDDAPLSRLAAQSSLNISERLGRARGYSFVDTPLSTTGSESAYRVPSTPLRDEVGARLALCSQLRVGRRCVASGVRRVSPPTVSMIPAAQVLARRIARSSTPR